MAIKKKRRKNPGTTGKGRFYRIEIRPKGEFVTFRNQDVGKKGDLERLAGKRTSGSWDTISWLLEKDTAHVLNGKLVITNPKVKRSLSKQIRGPVIHVKGNVFKAKPRKNVPEASKPTRAQKTTQLKNIRKAQKARWK